MIDPTAEESLLATTRLRFSPYAWAKLLFLRDYGPTEVGGFGITPADDLLYVADFQLIPQICTPVTVKFDDAAVADFFDDQVESGRQPEEFARIWIHTHPADSANPSHVDEETFLRVFGNCGWAVMAIVACGGETYSRLRFNVGPGSSIEIPIEVDFESPFPAADPDGWEQEYQTCVREDLSWQLWPEEIAIPEEQSPLGNEWDFGALD